jgi:2-polyprenyl-3-methyl-5-hydroxy-6-metoxy-1,4-benzoquinol methylase
MTSKSNWEASYERGENHIFFPKEEIVKFLNRYIRKKVSPDKFIDLSGRKFSRALDFGCGIGRQTVLLAEFGLQATGVDLSQVAIEKAHSHAKALGVTSVDFKLLKDESLSFRDNEFDVTVCESVLDSMGFETAIKVVRELDRVTNGYLFISLISGDDYRHHREFCGEEVVRDDFEKGTIQSYFNWEKIGLLLKGTAFMVHDAYLVENTSLIAPKKYGRYYLVLRNEVA